MKNNQREGKKIFSTYLFFGSITQRTAPISVFSGEPAAMQVKSESPFAETSVLFVVVFPPVKTLRKSARAPLLFYFIFWPSNQIGRPALRDDRPVRCSLSRLALVGSFFVVVFDSFTILFCFWLYRCHRKPPGMTFQSPHDPNLDFQTGGLFWFVTATPNSRKWMARLLASNSKFISFYLMPRLLVAFEPKNRMILLKK